ncbi:MAG: hypothetical protein AAGE43_01715 [Pseudomonadota bacterium]
MKYLLYTLGTLLGLVVLVFALQFVASESGEVVVLGSDSAEGLKETRLWVVEIDGVQYLRAGPDSGWYQRLLENPAATLRRADVTDAYTAQTQMAQAETLNALMREKYGWGDVVIEYLVGGRDEAVPVAMIPAG